MKVKNINDKKQCNHHHKLTKKQKVINLVSGKFVADMERIPLLTALNNCGLITRTHCYGHTTGFSFLSILLDKNMQIEIKTVQERDANRKCFNGKQELLINWKRTD